MKKYLRINKSIKPESLNQVQAAVRQNIKTCINIQKHDIISELKDYTFYEKINCELDPTWDIDPEINFNPFRSTSERKQINQITNSNDQQKQANISQISAPCPQAIDSAEIFECQPDKISSEIFLMDQVMEIQQYPVVKQEQWKSSEQQLNQPTKTKRIKRKLSQRLIKKNKEDKREKAETKNIPKNYGKVLIRYVQQSKELVQRILLEYPCEVNYQTFCEILENIKNDVRTKDQLLGLWRHPVYGQVMRIISQHFLRKKAYDYIFNSRVQDFRSALKYKPRLQEFVVDPWREDNLKY